MNRMERLEQAKQALAGATPEQRVRFAFACVDAVYPEENRKGPGYIMQWAPFVKAPFGQGIAREVAAYFSVTSPVEAHTAAQRAAAAAVALEEGDDGRAWRLVESCLDHAFAADKDGKLIDIAGCANAARAASPTLLAPYPLPDTG
ncbi:MAG TPA: hypothetical protein VFS43_20760 [Polyangiaceae bacterium]|nr:hypothetical protein [Polyangiaceae bacterium]